MRSKLWLPLPAISLLLLCAAPCWASYSGYYQMSFNSFGATNYRAGSSYFLSNQVYASDGKDAYDIPLSTITTYSYYVASYRTDGVEGWDFSNGFYGHECRPVFTGPGQTKVVDMYLWAAPGSPVDSLRLDFYGAFPTHGNCVVRLVSLPDGVSYNGQTVWNLQYCVPARATVPYYATTDGTTGYHFQATITAPEPSSMAAVCAGAGGLCLMLRRRKTR